MSELISDMKYRKFVMEAQHELLSHPQAALASGWRSAAAMKLRFAYCTQEIKLSAKSRVLDFGCGTGALAQYLRAQGYEGEYLGVDIVPAMVTRAQQDNPREQFICGGLDSVPEKHFDLTVLCGTFSYKTPQTLALAKRTLEVLWPQTEGALILFLPATRTRSVIPSGDLQLYSPKLVLSLISSLSPCFQLRQDLLPTDIVAILYRQKPPAFDALLTQLSPLERAWISLERGEPEETIRFLAGHEDAESLLLKGKAFKALEQWDSAREVLTRGRSIAQQALPFDLELAAL